MAWAAEDRAALALAEELFAPLGTLRARRMFGGGGLYADGLFFCILMGGEIYLKADAASEALFRAAGGRPFEYRQPKRGRVTRLGYWTLPESAVDDAEEALVWGRRALAAAARAG